MSQKTNLNIDPYYDDFNPRDNYHRVLFKPGFPVQSRELTSLQSILQNQIESFGNHIFKDGSVVLPGNVTYNDTYYAATCPNTIASMAKKLTTIKAIGPDIPVYCVIEHVHSFPGNSGRSMFTFGCNYGQWLGILATLKIPYIEVTPYKWMKHYPKANKQ